MGYQVIKQPDGLFALYSSNTDQITMWDATRDDVIEFFVEAATERARVEAERIVGLIEADKPRDAYFQFAKTWEDALASDRQRGGEAHRDFDQRRAAAIEAFLGDLAEPGRSELRRLVEAGVYFGPVDWIESLLAGQQPQKPISEDTSEWVARNIIVPGVTPDWQKGSRP
jgi:hypothetical protein